MGQTLRHWYKSDNYPLYEVGEMGEIRKIGTNYDQRLPQIWGRLDNGDPEWLVTIFDEELGYEVTVPTWQVTDHICIVGESYYEN